MWKNWLFCTCFLRAAPHSVGVMPSLGLKLPEFHWVLAPAIYKGGAQHNIELFHHIFLICLITIHKLEYVGQMRSNNICK